MVFDLDDSLVSSDSFARLLTHLLRRSPARLGLLALSAPAWLLLGARRANRLHAERIVIWTATVGLPGTPLGGIGAGWSFGSSR